ncbi:putative gluconokinase isoform X4 [Crassostrea virginica]
MIFVIMGVCGSGKSTVGSALAEKLEVAFRDADDFHSKENKEKMSQGIPLTDRDRLPWLLAIHEYIRGLSQGGKSGVVTCSALKKMYRDILVHGSPSASCHDLGIQDIVFVLLHGDREVLQERMKLRQGHFMPSTLLDSQLATLERPTNDEKCVQLDINQPCEDLVEQIIGKTKVLLSN